MHSKKVVTHHEKPIRLKTLRRYKRAEGFPNMMRFSMCDAKMGSLPIDNPSVKRKKRWVRWGKHFGFPMCCIKSFCRLRLRERTEAQKSIMKEATGFVPCPAHAEQIMAGELTIAGLIRNRKHKYPFPVDVY